jgi:hypothetical protein
MGRLSADLRLGGDYGTALCAAVANLRYTTVRLLVKKANLRVIGTWIRAGRQILLMTIRAIWRCTSCRCDKGGRGDDRTAAGQESGRGRLYV